MASHACQHLACTCNALSNQLRWGRGSTGHSTAPRRDKQAIGGTERRRCRFLSQRGEMMWPASSHRTKAAPLTLRPGPG